MTDQPDCYETEGDGLPEGLIEARPAEPKVEGIDTASIDVSQSHDIFKGSILTGRSLTSPVPLAHLVSETPLEKFNRLQKEIKVGFQVAPRARISVRATCGHSQGPPLA